MPATPTSSRSTWTQSPRCSTTGQPGGSTTAISASPSRSATKAASGRAAIGRPPGAKPITSTSGPRTDPQTSTTPPWSATFTTSCCTKVNGPHAWPTTASSRSSLPPGSTRTGFPADTPDSPGNNPEPREPWRMSEDPGLLPRLGHRAVTWSPNTVGGGAPVACQGTGRATNPPLTRPAKLS
ncbi:hypothetical protein AERO9AM_20719 [Aeromicrobium sp. 9AM]|nr:hypothetical protein AERO9AM_20719 [Aeromicrobium sp. 9AM]